MKFNQIDNVSIAKKLPLTVAGIAVLAAASAGLVGYVVSAQQSYQKSEKLLGGAADTKVKAVSAYFGSIESDIVELAASRHVLGALDRFTSAYDSVPNATETLQRLYIDQNPNPLGQKEKLDVAGDGSAYSSVHADLHPWFRSLLRLNGYYDIFLFDLQGRNVYTVFKERDFATDMVRGQWRDTEIAKLVREVTNAGASGKPRLADFQPYAPSNDVPAAFVAAPIIDAQGRMRGVIAIQASIDLINEAMGPMPANGTTGQSMLVGADQLMRSDSRFSEESTILQRKVEGKALEKALKGESGIVHARNLDGKAAVVAYRPVEIMGAEMAVLSDITRGELDAPLRGLALQMLLAALAVAGAAVFLGQVFARTLTRPIKGLTETMEALASGDTTKAPTGAARGDELGAMARTVEVFRLNAVERTRLEEEARIEAEARAKRGATIERISRTFDEVASDMLRAVAAATTELEATARAMTSNAERTNNMAANVAAAAEESTVNAQTAASSSGGLVDTIGAIESAVADSARITQEAVARAGEANASIATLSDATRKIGEVVDLIRGIAEQTNLLALNATIEAARAGEAGRGFAVVASEVKTLAEQTASATGDISQQIGAIQSAMGGAVGAISSINEVIQRLSQNADTIGVSIGTQSAATTEIARNVQEVANAAHTVASDITHVTEAASETGAGASQVLAASQELARQAETLERSVGQFLSDLRAA
jgi:methyl-accepting chemotaxis protein